MPSGTSLSASTSSCRYLFASSLSVIAPMDPMPLYVLKLRPWNNSTSPGASSVPANKPPSITESAPAEIAFAISPENLIPPSAIIFTFLSFKASLISSIAEICGTPMPATILVVHIDPGPIPTFTASTPAFASSIAASAVAMFPPMISMSLNSFLIN